MRKGLAQQRDTGEMHTAESDASVALRVRYGGSPVEDSDVKEQQRELVVPTHRIERLTDGIFAIAMTLLVLGIQVPALPANATSLEFSVYVTGILPQILTYVISLILLAVFWLDHHIFFKTNTPTLLLPG